MKRLFWIFVFFILSTSLVGCASVQHRQSLALSKGIYAEQSAMRAGRFDLAEKYNQQLTRLVPPPKRPIEVHNFTSQGKTYAVLPETFKDAPTLAAGSDLFNTALGNDKSLQSQLNAENKALGAFSKTTDGILRDKAKEAEKYEAQPSLWQKLSHWLKWLALPVLGLGIVALCFFCPAAIPFVLAAWKFLSAFFSAVVRIAGVALSDLAKLFKGKGNGP